VKYQRFVAGLRGDLGKSWNWDVSFQYSKSNGAYTDDQIYNDSVAISQFATGSCVGQVTAVRGVPCIDVPWLDPQFLAGNFSKDVTNFLFGQETGHTKYTQWTLEGYSTGKLFELPAGTVNAAIGAQLQSDSINDTPGPITLAGNAWGTTTSGITKGSERTKAIFGEVAVPLLRNLPAVKNLELNASVRNTNVDTYGSDSTYKVGLAWQLVPSFKIRLNQGTSFRSPALYELYLANQTSFLNQSSIDPCIGWQAALAGGQIPQRVADNCAAAGLPADFAGAAVSATIISGGGLGVLRAETSKSRTAGFVWHPNFANINLSVDFFDIEVRNEVSQLGAKQIVFSCYNSLFFPNDPLCNLFQRNSLAPGTLNPGAVDKVHDSYINIANQKERGWDIELTYETRVGPGKLIVNTQNTIKARDLQALFADTVEDTNGRFGNPKWVGNLNLTYEVGPWEYYYGLDLIGPVSNEKHYGGNTATYRGETVRVVLKSGSVIYHALSATREFKDSGIKATLGVANLADRKPPQVTTLDLGELDTQGNSAFYSQYDWIGRRFFLNLKKAF
jgi:outer membrane receptor protein involved in Fe transport